MCVESIRIYPKTLDIELGKWYYSVRSVVLPENAECKSLIWESSNSDIAAVNQSNGYIYGASKGTATITARAVDGSGVCDCMTVNVVDCVPVSSIALNTLWFTIEVGETYTLSATVYPNNATNSAVEWTSMDENVATVDNGVICGVSKGSTKIIAKSTDGTEKSVRCTVNVTNDTLVRSISISPSSKTMKLGESAYMYAEVCPEDATNKNVTWATDAPEIVTINGITGLVYANGIGSTKIYAFAKDGSDACCCCPIIVLPVQAECIEVCPKILTINVGESATLEATVYPLNTTDPTVCWTSSDDSVVEVNSESGTIVAKSSGTAYVYATAQDGSGVVGCCTVMASAAKNALKAIKQCYVRLDTSLTVNSILEGSNGHDIVLQEGDTVYLLDKQPFIDNNNRSWYRILYDGMMVYVTNDGSFEEITLPPLAAPEGRTIFTSTEGVLNLRATPDTSKTELGQFARGSELILTNEIPQNEKWYAVYGQTTDGIYSYGWCSGEYLGNNVTYAQSVYTATLKVRSSHSSNSEELGTISNGDVVVLIEANCYNDGTYIWHKISYNNTVAYVVAELSVDTDNPNFDDPYTEFVPLVGSNSINPIYSFSPDGVTMLKKLEGFKSSAYIASSSESLYTIGYGHVITDGTKSVTINGYSYSILTEELATTLLLQDLNDTFIPRFNSFLQTNNIALNQSQYDACIMDCFQKGQNIWANQVRLIAKFIFAKQHFDDYDKVLTAFLDGTTNTGLINRRTKEATLFVYNTYS